MVKETVKPLVADSGYFITGKCEQFRLNEPYAPFVQAFGYLVRQLLLKSPDDLAVWQNRLRRALGRSGSVIAGIIPEIELIVGPQPPVEVLKHFEAQNRFRLIFQNFARVFAQKEHPLVIFLDDLQWADPASVYLIQTLSEDKGGLHLLLIGAYRDNEIKESNPLRNILVEFDSKIPVRFISLDSLTVNDTCQFIADSLSCTQERAWPSAETLYRKTGGNPLFLRQLLQEVYVKKLLRYNGQDNCWEWEQSLLQTLPVAEDVVSLMLEKMRRLSEDTLNILKLAAFIGTQFDLGTLATLSGKTLTEIAAALEAVLLEGLVLPTGTSGQAHQAALQAEPAGAETKPYSSSLDTTALTDPTTSVIFLHDRVQQAAYAMVPVEEETEFHLKIGRLLLQSSRQKGIGEKLFAMMDHFNRCLEFISDPDERIELAGCNLMAGRQAKTTTAYDSALSYFKVGLEFLPDNSWDQLYQLTYDLYTECFQLEYLVGDSHLADELFECLLTHAKNKLEIASLYSIKIRLDSSRGRYSDAVQVGIKALAHLDVRFPAKASKAAFAQEILLLKWRLRHKEIKELVNWPQMSDPEQKMILELLTLLAAALNPVDPELYVLTILKAGNLSVKYGNTDFSPMGYIGFSIVMGSVLGDYGSGHEFVRAAVKLTENYYNNPAACLVNFVIGASVSHWTQHGKTSLDYLNKAVQNGLEACELNFVGAAASYILATKCFLGFPLPEIYEECQNLRSLAARIKHKTLWINTTIFQRLSLRLMGLSEDLSDWEQTEYDEDNLKKVSENILAAYFLAQIQLDYVSGEYAAALAVADKVQKLMYGHARKGYINVADYIFYYSLAISANFDALPAKRKRRYRQILKKNRQQMKKWSKHCAENFRHKYLTVEAEMARLAGRHLQAMSLWDQAIKSAQENGYLQNEAVAGELAAKYYLSQGRSKIAGTYMTEAWSAYMRWGAVSKAKALQEHYPGLLTGLNSTEETDKSTEMFKHGFENSLGSVSNPGGNLDISTIKKVVQRMSEDNNPETLLQAFLTLAMENAGADRGFLILEKGGELIIESIQESGTVPDAVVTPMPLEKSSCLSRAVVRYVARTLETLVINERERAGIFAKDPYLTKSPVQSIVCLPVLFQGIPAGVLYLENTVMSGVFVPERLDILKLLSTQMVYVKTLQTFLGVNAPGRNDASSPVLLTERELEVLRLIAAGLSNKEIARRLTLTLSTVKTHVLNIYGKLQVNRRVQAVTRAKELNLLKE